MTEKKKPIKIKHKETGIILEFDKKPTTEEADRRFNAVIDSIKTSEMNRDVSGTEMALPRVAEFLKSGEKTTGTGGLKLAGKYGLDILSGGTRLASAFPELSAIVHSGGRLSGTGYSIPAPTLEPERKEELLQQAKLKISDPIGKTTGEQILKDPATTAAAITAPFTGGLSFLPRVGTEALASVGTHQLEALTETGELKPKEGAIETGLTFLFGGVPTSANVKKKAADWMTKIVKPKVKLMDRFSSEKMLEKGITGSFESMIKKAKNQWDKAMEKFGQVIERHSDKTVDVRKALQKTKETLQKEMDKKKHLDVKKDLMAESDYWDEIISEFPEGPVPLDEAQNMKMSVGDKGDWNPQKSVREQKGAMRFNDEFYHQLDNQIDKVAPELKILNKELSELRPIRQGLKEAAHRTGNWNLIRLSDMMTYIPTMSSPTSMGRKVAASLMFLPRLASSPTAISELYNLSNLGPALQPTIFGAKRALATKTGRPEAIERVLQGN